MRLNQWTIWTNHHLESKYKRERDEHIICDQWRVSLTLELTLIIALSQIWCVVHGLNLGKGSLIKSRLQWKTRNVIVLKQLKSSDASCLVWSNEPLWSWGCHLDQSPNRIPWAGWISPPRWKGTTWRFRSCQLRWFIMPVYYLIKWKC